MVLVHSSPDWAVVDERAHDAADGAGKKRVSMKSSCAASSHASSSPTGEATEMRRSRRFCAMRFRSPRSIMVMAAIGTSHALLQRRPQHSRPALVREAAHVAAPW